MSIVRTEGSPIVISRAPDIDVDMVCKMRGDLKIGDVVFDNAAERFFKVCKCFVHVGHGAVVRVEGVYKNGTQASWDFNDFSGANCFVVAL